jgi:regulator of protease activity HflC (stomatin/prohibitin superfamily)
VLLFRKGDKVLFWSHERFPGVVWGVPNEDIPSLKDYEKFVVAPFERCFRVRSGGITEVSAGTHKLEDEDKKPGCAIYWCLVDRVWDVPFAVPRVMGLYTSDNVNIGFHGSVEFKITDPLSFLNSLVAERRTYTGGELKEWISERVVSASRELVKNYGSEELHRREMGKAYINAVITASIFDELQTYGVEFLNIRIEGITPPLIDILEWKRVGKELEEAKKKEEEVRQRIKQLDDRYADQKIEPENYRFLSSKYGEELEKINEQIKDLKFRQEILKKKIHL